MATYRTHSFLCVLLHSECRVIQELPRDAPRSHAKRYANLTSMKVDKLDGPSPFDRHIHKSTFGIKAILRPIRTTAYAANGAYLWRKECVLGSHSSIRGISYFQPRTIWSCSCHLYRCSWAVRLWIIPLAHFPYARDYIIVFYIRRDDLLDAEPKRLVFEQLRSGWRVVRNGGSSLFWELVLKSVIVWRFNISTYALTACLIKESEINHKDIYDRLGSRCPLSLFVRMAETYIPKLV
jgi:hypothetical protein